MMTLSLYNSLTKAKETFSPETHNHAKMYVCGPTVYDLAHIGNARPVVVFDVLFRIMKNLYTSVTYVRNITDVDDKINAAAAREGTSIDTITERTIAAYHKDMEALNAQHPTHEPRATKHIQDMIDMIATLIEKNHAYAAEGHVLFDVTSYDDYGTLSRRDTDELVAGARVEIAPYKKNAGDFVLWKPSTDDQPGWDSPWGFGRPGWHIECSAMSYAFLGDTFDIHGGGVDLVFPHHENEVAQSRCAHGTDHMAHTWMHNGHLTVNGEKMSKSLGNFLVVRDLLKQYPGEVIRFALLSTHYRQPLDFSDKILLQAKQILDRIYNALNGFDHVKPSLSAPDEFLNALHDDVNTPLAIAHLHKQLTSFYQTDDIKIREHIVADIKACGHFIGILTHDVDAWFGRSRITDDMRNVILKLLRQREDARKSKDFSTADTLRQKLSSLRVHVDDTPHGPIWKII